MLYDDALYGTVQASAASPYAYHNLCSHNMTAMLWNMALAVGTPNAEPNSGVVSGTIQNDDSQAYSSEGYSDSSSPLESCTGRAAPPDASTNQQPHRAYDQDPELGTDYSLHHTLRAPILLSNGPHSDDLKRVTRSTGTNGASPHSTRLASFRRGQDARAHGSITDGSASGADGQAGKEKHKLTTRSTHNVVERKYRMNLRDKIAELKAAVPSLQSAFDGNSDDCGERRHLRTCSKGTILGRATEYIRELEQANRVIASENLELIQRMRHIEAMIKEDCLVYGP